MTVDFPSVRTNILRELEAITEQEPAELRALRTGDLPYRPGCFGQYWTAWDFANGMIRDFSMYTVHGLYKLALTGRYDMAQLSTMLEMFHPPYTEYLGYSGYRTLQRLCVELRAAARESSDVDEFLVCYEAFLKYVNKLAAWSYHYFSWDIGQQQYRYAS
jgi:hypothetical protein